MTLGKTTLGETTLWRFRQNNVWRKEVKRKDVAPPTIVAQKTEFCKHKKITFVLPQEMLILFSSLLFQILLGPMPLFHISTNKLCILSRLTR
jgi:hypothetical protein